MLQAGQSSITLDGANISFACPGNFTVKGGQHLFDTGQKSSPQLGKLPDTKLRLYDEGFILKDTETGEPIANHTYRILRADGTYETGTTDESGRTHLISSSEVEKLTLELIQS